MTEEPDDPDPDEMNCEHCHRLTDMRNLAPCPKCQAWTCEKCGRHCPTGPCDKCEADPQRMEQSR